jgi:hypothetical protein
MSECAYFPKKIESCSGGIFKGMPNEDEFKKLWNKSPWDALSIANVAWYVDYDVEKTELILRTASQLGLSYMDICQLIDKPLKNTV